MRYQMRDIACGLVKIVDTKRNRCLMKPHGDEFYTRTEARALIDQKEAEHNARQEARAAEKGGE